MKRFSIVFLFVAAFLLNHGYSFSENNTKDLASGDLAKDVNLVDFILGPGDKVEIKVYRNEDLNYTVQIDPSGKISYPLLGDVRAAGMTVFKLRESIAKGLAKFIKDPQVSVNLISYQSHKIAMLGEVTTPGVVVLDTPLRIFEAISKVGGLSSNADKSNVVVIRKDQADSVVMSVDLKKVLEGDKSQDILLKRDDIVYVPKATNKLTVLGEVTNPGSVVLDRELSESPIMLLDAVTKAGGFSSNADKTGIVIIRKDGDKAEIKSFNIKRVLDEGDLSQNVVVQKGDIIFVPKVEQRIVVMGEVTTPGVVVLDTPLRIFEAISKVGGFSANANKNNILLIRDDGGRSKIISVDIQKSLETGDISQNLLLQKGDIIFIPKETKRVIVLGEVKNPGFYSFDLPLTIVDAISKAGGSTSSANNKKVAIIRKGKDKTEYGKLINLKKILKEGGLENIILSDGDIVYVPTTFIADVETVLGHIRTIFSTFTNVMSPIVLWPQVKSTLEGDEGQGTIIIPSSQ